jgi:hypothetical protein
MKYTLALAVAIFAASAALAQPLPPPRAVPSVSDAPLNYGPFQHPTGGPAQTAMNRGFSNSDLPYGHPARLYTQSVAHFLRSSC